MTIAGVFLAYNANSGLPFVPTYDLRAELPDAANLVEGNEVRLAGQRVGVIDRITPVHDARAGRSRAVVSMKLDSTLEPLPADSTLIVRPRSALGLKYIEITPGSGRTGFPDGATVPLAQATPEPVEIDEFLNGFAPEVRRGAQRSLDGAGAGLAGRGADLNVAIHELRPLLRHLEPVAAGLAAPDTRLSRLLRALGRTAGEVAPVAERQAELLVGLDATFAALAGVADPFIQETISRSLPAQEAAIAALPRQRQFLRNARALARELRPGVAALPSTARELPDAAELGTPLRLASGLEVFGGYLCGGGAPSRLAPGTNEHLSESTRELIQEFVFAGSDSRPTPAPPCTPQAPLGQLLGQTGLYPQLRPLAG